VGRRARSARDFRTALIAFPQARSGLTAAVADGETAAPAGGACRLVPFCARVSRFSDADVRPAQATRASQKESALLDGGVPAV
jgi:hypothetical protein